MSHSISGARTPALGDFSATPRVIAQSVIAIGIGVLAAVVALILLKLIALFTNLFFFQRWVWDLTSPAAHHLGWISVFVPVAGGLIVGVMARYGSERIRGHGIPEALEAILIRGSRVEPRVAILKPISAAISIGSGGPFGAEGPIIMTGGAFGSLIAQFFHLTNAERKTLLVAGATAGMSATFAAPLASVLLGVELLLFELKPRSFIPVSLACAAAMVVRHFLLGPGPLFVVPMHSGFVGISGILGCMAVGLSAGMLSALMTASVYASEDWFKKLPVHWMWWPALGGLVVGMGGLICPRALGVGYETIHALLNEALPIKEVLLLFVVKWAIWAIYLGSGTSGGVLAPLLMLGSALGGIWSLWLPAEGVGFWPLIALSATLGGTMRAPFTSVIFAVELTANHQLLLPLLVASTVSHGFTVLVLKRSILTEKVARRGFHVTREYAIDPFEVLFVREVMTTRIFSIADNARPSEITQLLAAVGNSEPPLWPVLGQHGSMLGVANRRQLEAWLSACNTAASTPHLLEFVSLNVITAHPDEPLAGVLFRMAETGHTRLPVVAREAPRRILGIVTLANTLKAKQRHLEEERRRERIFPLILPLRRAMRQAPTSTPTPASARTSASTSPSTSPPTSESP